MPLFVQWFINQCSKVVTEFQINSSQNICCASIIPILITLQFICKCFGNDMQSTFSVAQLARGSKRGSDYLLDLLGVGVLQEQTNLSLFCASLLKICWQRFENQQQVESARGAEAGNTGNSGWAPSSTIILSLVACLQQWPVLPRRNRFSGLVESLTFSTFTYRTPFSFCHPFVVTLCFHKDWLPRDFVAMRHFFGWSLRP